MNIPHITITLPVADLKVMVNALLATSIRASATGLKTVQCDELTLAKELQTLLDISEAFETGSCEELSDDNLSLANCFNLRKPEFSTTNNSLKA